MAEIRVSVLKCIKAHVMTDEETAASYEAGLNEGIDEQ